MKPTRISTPRWKLALCLGASLLPVAIGLLMQDRSHPDAWKLELATIFFGLCSAAFAWLLVSPGRVLLDAEGFTVRGGFVLTPWTVRWRDVDAFLPFTISRSHRVVGFRYRAGFRHPFRRRFTRFGGVDELLPIWWRSTEKVVEQLNAYRTQALGGDQIEATRNG